MAIERAVVTGASGFVGTALVRRLAGAHPLALGGPDWERALPATDWHGATVFHLAARVHQPGVQTEADYVHDNVEKTRALARSAARGGARRLIFVSTIKVNGERTTAQPFRSSDAPRPQDAYARSKLAAERALHEVAGSDGLEVVVVRPPLVFGPGVRGNLAALLALCDTPWPLPFGAIRNRRSFIDVGDLAALLVHLGQAPHAAGRTFLAAHGEPVSSASLVATMRRALGRPERLLRVPPALLRAMATLAGRGEPIDRLTEDLEIDATELERELGWRAQVGAEASVRAMARAWREGQAA